MLNKTFFGDFQTLCRFYRFERFFPMENFHFRIKIFHCFLCLAIRDEWQVLSHFLLRYVQCFLSILEFHCCCCLTILVFGWMCVFLRKSHKNDLNVLVRRQRKFLSSDAKAEKTSIVVAEWLEPRNHRLLKLVFLNRRWAGFIAKKYTRFSKTFQLLPVLFKHTRDPTASSFQATAIFSCRLQARQDSGGSFKNHRLTAIANHLSFQC